VQKCSHTAQILLEYFNLNQRVDCGCVVCAIFVDPNGECRPDLRLKGHQKEG